MTVRSVMSRMDHPRSRGVYDPPFAVSPARRGSSPLARGLRQHCARISDRREDHPRSRGVYTSVMPSSMIAAGSSPLARGLPQGLFELLGDRRIIPARAGFTAKGGVWYRSSADHPRSRGVYMRSPSFICDTAGSSPLARGLQIGGPLVIHRSRIIPARAGFTRQLLELRRGLWDHPRSRGVYGTSPISRRRAAGSSPLARGLRTML